MLGEICSSGRVGKVCQTKYGPSGCAFSPFLVPRPDLELCSDSHLHVLVKNERSHNFCSLGFTVAQLKPFVGLFRSSIILTFCWSATNSNLNLDLAFSSPGDTKSYFTLKLIFFSVSAAYKGRVCKRWFEVASTIH